MSGDVAAALTIAHQAARIAQLEVQLAAARAALAACAEVRAERADRAWDTT